MAKTINTTTAPTGQIAPFGLRMLPDLRTRVEEAARDSGRSMNAEIISRLQISFDLPVLNFLNLEVEKANNLRDSQEVNELMLLRQLADERLSRAEILGGLSSSLANMLHKATALLTSEQRKLHPEVGVFEAVADGVLNGNGMLLVEMLNLAGPSNGTNSPADQARSPNIDADEKQKRDPNRVIVAGNPGGSQSQGELVKPNVKGPIRSSNIRKPKT